ncbi:sulfite exporter TauE/SafE family protein [uncultured Campylobacter sp.]|uniref:sulfite exporter TauE/SafE family protein n=1 Tax=uncultured Campylobacter sp. TaxID=218934 RepID=UPI0026293761|nr:sulfite exporter TauE/SafE family protein [uncultured Campylobacter sp.]
MFFEYILIGVAVGFISGFFGIGGGTVVVPVMMLFGYDVKYAIGISIMQMIFSSIFGSFVNFKSKMLDVAPALVLGLGGFCGALSSGFIVSYFSSKFLLGTLILVQIINLIKLFKTPTEPTGEANESKILLFIVGLFVGAVAISVGIGGAVFVMPILISFLNYDIKKAVSTGLFFVIFSSSAGFLSLSAHGLVYYKIGALLGIGSLAGVYAGVKTSHKIGKKAQKRWMIALIVTILCITVRKFLALS